MKYCQYCGQELHDEAVICSRCGRQTNESNEPIEKNVINTTPTVTKKNTKIKVIIAIALAAILVVISILCFRSCPDGDRYELTSITGLGITTQAYEYNYIDFNFEKNTYTLKNKAKQNGIVTEQSGTFMEDQFGGVKITNKENPSQNYFLYYRETLLFSSDHNKFYAKATINGYQVVLTYTKK